MRFGATDAFAQAVVLSLYDPDRSQTVLRDGQIDTGNRSLAELQARLERHARHGGRGLRMLTETVVSPTLADQLQQLLWKSIPMRRGTSTSRSTTTTSCRAAGWRSGRRADASSHVDRADVILVAGCRLSWPTGRCICSTRAGLPTGGALIPQRMLNLRAMNRLYVVETSLTSRARRPTIACRSSRVRWPRFALRLATALGLTIDRIGTAVNAMAAAAEIPQGWLACSRDDLQRLAAEAW